MKKLDILSRVEMGTYWFLAGAIVFGLPAVLAFDLIEQFLPVTWPALGRYTLAVAGAGVVWFLAFVAAASVGEAFSGVRRLLRRPPIDQAIADVDGANRGYTFVADPDASEIDRARTKEFRWVTTYQMVAALVVVTAALHHLYAAGGWSGWVAGLAGIALAYWCTTEIVGRVDAYIDQQRKEIAGLRRQLAEFVCDIHDGVVDKADMKRLGAVLRGESQTRSGRRLGDEWALINRSWAFWRDGFEEQDNTTCTNCGAARGEHGDGGRCPERGFSTPSVVKDEQAAALDYEAGR